MTKGNPANDLNIPGVGQAMNEDPKFCTRYVLLLILMVIRVQFLLKVEVVLLGILKHVILMYCGYGCCFI